MYRRTTCCELKKRQKNPCHHLHPSLSLATKILHKMGEENKDINQYTVNSYLEVN